MLLLTLPLRLPPAVEPSSALRSRNPVHSSANDSLFAGDSAKNSVDRDGVLGVRWKGDMGKRKLLFDAPGLARPACSFCSSVQLRRAAINCRIWNFLGSERSRARNCKTWFVTICLVIVSRCKACGGLTCLPVNIVLWLGFLEESQGFREMVIEDNCFMP